MNDHLAGTRMQTLSYSLQIANLKEISQFYNNRFNWQRIVLTFMFEVIKMVLCHDEVSFLHPAVLVIFTQLNA